jgi:hypothetical protein
MELVRADAVLATSEQPQRGKPLVQTERRIVKDRPELDRELLAADATLPDATGREEHRHTFTAMRAHGAVRPTQLRDERQRVVRVREVGNRFGKRLWRGGAWFHALNLGPHLGCVEHVIGA